MKRALAPAWVPALAALALIASGCSTDDGAASPAMSSSSAAATAAPSPTWAPSNGLHVKVVYQLAEPMAPEDCNRQGTSTTIGVGTPVAVSDANGEPIGTAELHMVEAGDAFGPGGHTFDGWADAPVEKGKRVTHACFYLADFPTTPSSLGYQVSVNGGEPQSFDLGTVEANGGWLPVLT